MNLQINKFNETKYSLIKYIFNKKQIEFIKN